MGSAWGHRAGTWASPRPDDEEYMEAAAEAVHKGKWGMFCIPGIAELSDIDRAAEAGMGFVRVGTEVSDVDKGKPFIERARAKGLFVFANLMKSYVCDTPYFVAQASKCIEYGAQCVYVVDSAGGMLPEEIGAYADALRVASPGVKLGFHGHNNLGLGVANSLHCARIGFDVIDTSLQGFGRSAGNTPTEQFVSVLIRAGFPVAYDAVAVMEAGEELIRPLIQEIGHNSLDTTAGLARFHTSYMRRVLDAAKAKRVDPRRLILALCERDRDQRAGRADRSRRRRSGDPTAPPRPAVRQDLPRQNLFRRGAALSDAASLLSGRFHASAGKMLLTSEDGTRIHLRAGLGQRRALRAAIGNRRGVEPGDIVAIVLRNDPAVLCLLSRLLHRRFRCRADQSRTRR